MTLVPVLMDLNVFRMCYSPVQSSDSSMTLVPVSVNVLQFCVIYGFVFRMCYSPVESLDSSMTLVPVLIDVLQFRQLMSLV
jgi:hypothetical protein